MEPNIRILRFEEIKPDLIAFFKNRSLIPIVGSGLSFGTSTYNGSVPSGESYKLHMLEELSKNQSFSAEDQLQLKSSNFSKLCDYYEDDENVKPEIRLSYLKNNFNCATYDDNDERKLFFEIEWPYIYTLNIDDAIERASIFSKVILPNRPFREEIFSENEEKCLIKLHGDIKEILAYNDGNKIFTSKEYALSLEKNAPILNKLKNDYAYQNILFIGCSLEDEFDIKTLSTMPIDFKVKNNLSRTIIFVQGYPGKLQISNYKAYGITDVVYFDNYEEMYQSLVLAWRESKKIQIDEIEPYGNIQFSSLKSTQKKENQEYFFWGKGLFDSKTQTLHYPYYFIHRYLASDIIQNLCENKVHLIYGNRISGKSYLLADLYQTIRDREVYYFDGKSRLSEDALIKLIYCERIVVLLDIGTLSREQFEQVLLNAQTINANGNNFVITLNKNDSDTLGIIKWKLKEGIIQSTDLREYYLKNKFVNDENELCLINSRLPSVSLPPYSENRTFLDQSIYAEKQLQIKGRFTKTNIKIDTPKQLSLLIILAIKEKLYSIDIINFALDEEIIAASKKYAPFIERVETMNFEKDAVDLSSIKYVLNSKYWLRRELGNYARVQKNYSTVADAYKYIIRKVIEFSGHDEYRQRRECRNYILFDVMNEIFLDEYGGNLALNVYLYTQLHELLSTDFHFLHQNAKCYLNYSYVLNDPDEKWEYLTEARELAVVAKSMIECSFEESSHDRLLISMAHTQYTIATILCELCALQDYSDIKAIQDTIDAIKAALTSPYNYDDYRRERRERTSRGIIKFVKNISLCKNELGVNAEYQAEIDFLSSFVFWGATSKKILRKDKRPIIQKT